MKTRNCNECGGPLVCTYTKEDLYFYIDEHGNVVRDTNQDLWNGEIIEFHCSNNTSHNIMPQPGEEDYEEYERWRHEFENEINKIIAEENL